MRPGKKVMMSFSNRCFPTKGVAVWLSSDDVGRLSIIGRHFHHSEEWKGFEAFDMLEKKEVVRPSFVDVIMDHSRAFMCTRDVMGSDPMLASTSKI